MAATHVKLRLPIAVAVVPVGLIVGALLVGRPVTVENDLVLDPAAVSSTTSAPPVTPPSSTSTSSTTTTSMPDSPVDPAASIVVANASNISGVASREVGKLAIAGFTNAVPTDALNSPVTHLYAREGFESTAEAVAQALELGPLVVEPFPTGAVTPLDDEADVLVLVGDDRAGSA